MADLDGGKPEQLPHVEFNELGGLIVDDIAGDFSNVSMDKQPEIVHAASNALKQTDIPNSRLVTHQAEDGTVHLANEATTYFDGGDGSAVTLEDRGVTLKGAASHVVGAYIDIRENESGGYNVGLEVRHGGSYDRTIDASTTFINYEFDGEGNLLSRDGGTYTEEFGGDITLQEHGKWTINAAQTLEHNFSKIYGVEEKMDSLRPPSAATEAGAAPVADNSKPLSSIDFDKMQKNAGISDPKPGIEAQTHGM